MADLPVQVPRTAFSDDNYRAIAANVRFPLSFGCHFSILRNGVDAPFYRASLDVKRRFSTASVP
jgi:hypothetical protein